MKSASINEVKRELNELSPQTLIDVCIRVAKYKKENKEFLSYLLFEADDQAAYIKSVKEETDNQFESINKSNIYFAKKSLRKILRIVNKHIKFSGNKQTEAELLIYYCHKLKASGIRFQRSAALLNLYKRQVEKIRKALSTLHEDLQNDYEKEIKSLTEF